MEINLQYLREIENILLGQVELGFKRFLYDEIHFGSRLVGIIGPRGTGKTTLILQYLKEHHSKDQKSIYLLADNVFLKKGDLLEFARDFHLKHGGTLICIDEVHRFENWNQELKNIYDSFPDLKVIFSGSSSLDLIQGKYDLSRRGVLYSLPGLSFREYLVLEKGITLPKYTLKEIIEDSFEISKEVTEKTKFILQFFNEYLRKGYYPFYREAGEQHIYYDKILNTVDKAIYEDIASFYNLKTQNLLVFKKILNFLTTITPGEVNINKLAKNLGYNHATIAEYLEILHSTSLIRFLPAGKAGHASLKDAKKIFLDNTNLAYALFSYRPNSAEIGTIRELFVLNQLQSAGYIPIFSKEADIQVDKYTFEIGGKNKNANQLKDVANSYLVLDDILIGESGKIPLYLFGLLY